MICRKESKNEVKTFTIFSRYSHLRYLHAQKRVTIVLNCLQLKGHIGTHELKINMQT